MNGWQVKKNVIKSYSGLLSGCEATVSGSRHCPVHIVPVDSHGHKGPLVIGEPSENRLSKTVEFFWRMSKIGLAGSYLHTNYTSYLVNHDYSFYLEGSVCVPRNRI